MVSHDSFNSMPMLLNRSTSKLAQESHDVDNVGYNTISDVLEASNEAHILCLSNTISSVLKEFNLYHKVYLQVYNENNYISLRSIQHSEIDPNKILFCDLVILIPRITSTSHRSFLSMLLLNNDFT